MLPQTIILEFEIEVISLDLFQGCHSQLYVTITLVIPGPRGVNVQLPVVAVTDSGIVQMTVNMNTDCVTCFVTAGLHITMINVIVGQEQPSRAVKVSFNNRSFVQISLNQSHC